MIIKNWKKNRWNVGWNAKKNKIKKNQKQKNWKVGKISIDGYILPNFLLGSMDISIYPNILNLIIDTISVCGLIKLYLF